MRRPRTYAAAINDFTEHQHCSPVDDVVHNPRFIEIARQFGKTPEQVSLDINHIYIDSYRCRAPSKVYGYARVSTGGQSLDAQVAALRAAGARMIFKETASGAKKDRAQLGRSIESIVLRVRRSIS